MKLSVVMAYYNRKHLLFNTLKSIALSSVSKSDYEIVIVDDGSDPDQALTHSDFEGLPVRLVSIGKQEKTWVNSCVAHNRGIDLASGECVIIQNPECYHVGDVLKYAVEHISNEYIISFCCYNVSKDQLHFVDEGNPGAIPLLNIGCDQEYKASWYNHPIYRPVAFHFCNAISLENLRDLNGFDERMGKGIAYEDNEFLTRLGRKGIPIIFPDLKFGYVLHQFHGKYYDSLPNSFSLRHANNLMHQRIQGEQGWKAVRQYTV